MNLYVYSSECIILIKYVSANLFTCRRQWGKCLFIAHCDLSDHAFFPALPSISLSLSISPLTRLARITLTAAIYRNKVRIRVRLFRALFPYSLSLLATMLKKKLSVRDVGECQRKWVGWLFGINRIMTELIGEMMFGREGLSVRNGFFFQYSERFMDGSISQRVLDFGQVIIKIVYFLTLRAFEW